MFTNYEITGAFAKGSSWFTPIEVPVEKNLFIISESIKKQRFQSTDYTLGNDFVYCSDLTNINCYGVFDTYLHFNKDVYNDVLEFLMYCAMGNEQLTLLTGDVSSRILRLATNIFGLFGTLALNKIVAVHEFPSVKINGFNIYGEAFDLVKIKFYTLASDRNITSVINTISHLREIELYQQLYRDNIVPTSLRYGCFYLGDYGGGLTEYSISSFDFNFNRNLTPDFVADGSRPNQTLEPMGIDDTQQELTLEIIMNYYSSSSFITDFELQNFKRGRLEFIGPYIGNSIYRYKFVINFNKMKIINEEDIINTAGLQPLTLQFILLDDGNKPFDIEIVSDHVQSF